VNEPVTREEWRLVRTRTTERGEQRLTYGRSREGEQRLLEIFTYYAAYGPPDVAWTIEKYTVTERLDSIRSMTSDEVAEAVRVEVERGGGR
jgi:hypothetical protein